MNDSQPAQRCQVPCQNLRCKEMYHQPLGQEDDQFSSGQFWCTRTHENFGPDGQPVSKAECLKGRPCFGS